MSGLLGNMPVDPKDPWALAQTGYSPDKIYTRSTNGHDHSETIYVKVSPAVAAAMREAVEKVSGYRSNPDFIRDAMIHRLHQINDWMKAGINIGPVDVEVRMAEIERINANRQYWDQLINELDKTLGALIRDGDWEVAGYLIEQNGQVDSMTPPYQARLAEVLDRHRENLARITPQFDEVDVA